MTRQIFFDDLDPKHRQEWIDSAIADELITANLHTVSDPKTIDRLLNLKGTRWKPVWANGGGWVCWSASTTHNRENLYSGVQFKPDAPRLNEKQKPIKYESARGKGEAPDPLFLTVPDLIWDAIALRWSQAIGSKEYELGFWNWVEQTKIPIFLTEGAKKAACLLSHGYAAISLAGVANGQYVGAIAPLLKPYCSLGRKVFLAFDSDLHTKFSVKHELDRLARLLAGEGSNPHVLLWAEDYKGIDDLIAANGKDALEIVYANAKTYEAYHREREDNDDETPIEEHFNQIAAKALYGDCPYVCIDDKLHRWTGTHYEPSLDGVERRRISEYCHNYLVFDSQRRRRVHKFANDNSVSSVLAWQKVRCSIDPRKVNPTGINLANGVLSIQWHGNKPTWTLDKHDPKRIYTYVSCVRYDETADPTDCERLLIALDDGQRAVFLRTCAAALDLPNVRKHNPARLRALLLKGDGSNGKDTLREAIAEIFCQGLTGCSFRDFQQYDEGRKFPLAKLAHSRINWSSENHSNLSLDKLQVLKNIITGDPIDIELKKQDDYSIKPACVQLLNCNEAPSIVGAQKAIATRYAIVKFGKTFTTNPTSADEIQADPRFKNDPDFLREKVCPALLNELLKSLQLLMSEGIDYQPLESAIAEVQEESCHLIRWAREIQLAEGKGRIKIGDLFDSLQTWYEEQGILETETTDKGKAKVTWLEEGNRYDPFVKAPRLMRQALTKVFPRAKFSEKTEHGFFVQGIQSPFFVISPNFGSFGSGEEEEVERVRVLEAEPNPEPNYFASGNDFGSADPILNQNPNPEPNNFAPEPKKPDNHAIPEPTEPTEPKSEVVRSYTDETVNKGDEVAICKLKTFQEAYPKVRNIPDSGWVVTEKLKGDKVQIRHSKNHLTFEVPSDWVFKVVYTHA